MKLSSILVFGAGALCVPLIIGIAAVAGALESDARTAPPGWEIAIGSAALNASLQRRAHRLAALAPADQASLLRGMTLYRRNCAGCHGDAREPSAWGGRNFYPRVPQFWQEPVNISPEQAYSAVRDGIRYSGMGAWADLMPEDEMRDVARFVAALHALPEAVDQEWRGLKP